MSVFLAFALIKLPFPEAKKDPLYQPDAEFCALSRAQDERYIPRVLERAEDSKVVMLGIPHGPVDSSGDARDGEFIAGLLPRFQERGYEYLAVECPYTLNPSLKKKDLTEAKKVFGVHWTEFGPAIERANSLGMKVVCYDVDYTAWRGSNDEREEFGLGKLEELIFKRDEKAKVITCSGFSHAYAMPVKESFLNPNEIIPLGMLLKQKYGEKVLRVMIQPAEKTIYDTFNFDFTFYLGKQC